MKNILSESVSNSARFPKDVIRKDFEKEKYPYAKKNYDDTIKGIDAQIKNDSKLVNKP